MDKSVCNVYTGCVWRNIKVLLRSLTYDEVSCGELVVPTWYNKPSILQIVMFDRSLVIQNLKYLFTTSEPAVLF